MACGMSVAGAGVETGTSGEGDSAGGTSGGDVSGDDATGGSSTGPDSTETGTMNTTGGEADPALCWSSVWTEAPGIRDIWADGTTALVAAEGLIVEFDGEAWHRTAAPDELPYVIQVAASTADDAWFAGSRRSELLHFNGDAEEFVPLPLETPEWIMLEVDGDGDPWALIGPDRMCGIGPCPVIPPQMHHLEGGNWVEIPDAQWVRSFDVVGDTVWAVGWEGVAARWTGDAWDYIESQGTETFVRVEAVSSTELWITGDSGAYWHWLDGVLTTGEVEGGTIRDLQVEGGVAYALTQTGEESFIERVEDEGRTPLLPVSSTERMLLTEGPNALLVRTPPPSGSGIYIDRVSDLEGAAELTTEVAWRNRGDFSVLFPLSRDEAIGFSPSNGLQRFVDGAWSTVEGVYGGQIRSIWGTSTTAFFMVHTDGALWQGTARGVFPASFPVDDPGLSQVWGDGQAVYAAGARVIGTSGVFNELLVMRFDGSTWVDLSPGINNIGDSNRVDIHGVGEHLYVSTAGSLHHLDESGWTSVPAPLPSVGLQQVRAFAPDRVFVVDGDGRLQVHDGQTWQSASALWPELPDVPKDMRVSLSGNAAGGIVLTVAPRALTQDAPPSSLWTFDGVGWELLDLPETLWNRAPLAAVAEDGSSLWIDDLHRSWTRAACE